jgi:hypothetical protein
MALKRGWRAQTRDVNHVMLSRLGSQLEWAKIVSSLLAKRVSILESEPMIIRKVAGGLSQ